MRCCTVPKKSRQRFIDAYKAVTTVGHPQYELMKELIEIHGNEFWNIHTSSWFLPWHRWYTYAIENVLRNEDCRVTMPWWRWSKKSTTWETGTPFANSVTWLGTGAAAGTCTNNGPFAAPGWYPSSGASNQCLRRNFYTTGTGGDMPAYSVINTVLGTASGDYTGFSDDLESLVHNLPHGLIGGDMGSQLSPREPTFFLHHNYIDQLWDRWQRLSPAHLASYSDSMSDVIPYTVGPTPNLVGDHFDLAGPNSRVKYVNQKSNPSGPGHLKVLPFCLMIRFELSLNKIFNIERLEESFLMAAEKDKSWMLKVHQLPPDNPTEEEFKKMFKFWYDGPDKIDPAIIDEKVKQNLELKRRVFEATLNNQVTQKELDQTGNPGSSNVGYDLDDEMIQRVLKQAKVCQEGYEYKEDTGCVVNDEAFKLLKKEIQKKGTVFDAEPGSDTGSYAADVYETSSLPTDMLLHQCKDKGCADANGTCVSAKDCDKKRNKCKKNLCSVGKTCVCMIAKNKKPISIRTRE